MLRDAVLAWADDAYAVGSQLAAVTGLYGPQLEENLALGSFAQDHLGHARMLYLQLAAGDAAVDALIFGRDAEAYRTSLLAGEWRGFDWAFVCARGLCYALAERVRCRFAERSDGEIADIARTIARDTAVHVEHWREWLRAIAAGGESARVAPLLVHFAELTGEFFSERDFPGEADAMLASWLADLRTVCAETGVQQPGTGVAELRAAAARLAAGGLAGREGRHGEALRALIAEAASVYRAHPGVQLV